MNEVTTNNLAVERTILASPGLVALACLVGFTLHSWSIVFTSFIILLVATIVSRIRVLSIPTFLVSMGIVSWGFGSAFYRNFERQTSTFGAFYVLCVGAFLSLILLALFGYILGAVFGHRSERFESNNAIDEESSQKTSKEQPPQSPEFGRGEVFDPYSVLGLNEGATHDEIRSAYRTQMQLYHPDRVEHLGSELKRTAHDQALLIQRALEELLPKKL